MSFNQPIRVSIVNSNKSLSDSNSHWVAHTRNRYHHVDQMGLGTPIWLKQKGLSSNIRDDPADIKPHVFDRSKILPDSPVLFHHPPKAMVLPSYQPTISSRMGWSSSVYGVHYTGECARSIGTRNPPKTVAVRPDFRQMQIRTMPNNILPPAGKQTGVYERSIRSCTLHEGTYP